MGEADLSTVVYCRRQNVVLRQVAGEHLLVPIRNDVAQMQAIYALTGVGVRVWELLDGTRSLAAVRDSMVSRFEVDADQAWADLRAFVDGLAERDLVERR